MRSPVLVLWDLDLTLLDPAGFGTRVFGPALREALGREGRVGFRFAGMTDRAICTRLLVENGADPVSDSALVDPALVDRLLAAFADGCERRADELLAHGGGPLPGAHDALAALASAGPDVVVQGVATGNSRRTALLKLDVCGLRPWLDGTIGGYGDDHLDRRHLVADAVASAASATGGSVGPDSRIVVVGDTVADVRGALDTGAVPVGVASGYTDAADLRAAGAAHVVPDLVDTGAVVAAVLG